jgi:hypothetical protein
MSTFNRTCAARLLAAVLALGLAACAAPERTAATAPQQQQLLADWQAHSFALINRGTGLSPGTTSWMVPALVPRGTYRLVARRGDRAELIDGYRFEVDAMPGKELRLQLPMGHGSVEAVDERFVAGRAGA